LLISLSYNFPTFDDKEKTVENFWHLFLRDVGISLFPIGLVSFIYEVILRNNFIVNMTKTITEIMPGRYKNMRESGIVDVYSDLKIDKLKTDIEKVHRTEIRIIDIWMENFNRIENAIITALKNRKCEVKILLWNPMEIDAIENRARSLRNGTTTRAIVDCR
jgi:hypothetical protein